MVRIGTDVSPLPSRRAHVDEENRQALGALLRLLLRRGAREQEHQVGMFGAAGPDLLAVDDVAVLPSRLAKVFSDEVSVPLVGSVTPNACSRSSPLAICGSHFAFCSSLPCRSTVPMVYIWAWQAPALQPARWISSRIAVARRQFQPGAAIFLGDQHREVAGFRQRIARSRSGRPSRGRACASIRRGTGAEFRDRVADVGVFVLLLMGVSSHCDPVGRGCARRRARAWLAGPSGSR